MEADESRQLTGILPIRCINMQLVANPTTLMSLAVAFRVNVTSLGKTIQQAADDMLAVRLSSRVMALGRSSPFFGRPRFTGVFTLISLFAGFSRALIAVESLEM